MGKQETNGQHCGVQISDLILRDKEKPTYLTKGGGGRREKKKIRKKKKNLWFDSEFLHKEARTQHPSTLCCPPQKTSEGKTGTETLFFSSYFFS